MNPERDPISAIIHKAVLECLASSLPALSGRQDPVRFFNSPDSLGIKEEIVRSGRKLWERQYVDGNGGNLSARISSRHVICTPTLLSKADLDVDDLCLVDLDNEQVCGGRQQTSEIRMHLEIYKAVPRAKAVVHCHPPHATAFAVAGIVPQGNLLPEQEIFIGPVAMSPYETPGTQKFAETVLPFVENHNTILLANHGVVCWGDTITHAEWYVEVVDTYCKTILLASQLKNPLQELPPDKIAELLETKRKLGLPDARFAQQPCPSEECGNVYLGGVRPNNSYRVTDELLSDRIDTKEITNLVESIAEEVKGFLTRRK
jgi:L-fuculose-phosphate aldolase